MSVKVLSAADWSHRSYLSVCSRLIKQQQPEISCEEQTEDDREGVNHAAEWNLFLFWESQREHKQNTLLQMKGGSQLHQQGVTTAPKTFHLWNITQKTNGICQHAVLETQIFGFCLSAEWNGPACQFCSGPSGRTEPGCGSAWAQVVHQRLGHLTRAWWCRIHYLKSECRVVGLSSAASPKRGGLQEKQRLSLPGRASSCQRRPPHPVDNMLASMINGTNAQPQWHPGESLCTQKRITICSDAFRDMMRPFFLLQIAPFIS